jgi:hypothetical protein
MPASAYLTGPADFESYGVPLANPANVMRASLLIDHYLRRPEGLIWAPDANGMPAWMVAKSASMTFNYPGVILPGVNVTVPIAGWNNDSDSVMGEMVLLDRPISGITEVCEINAQQPGSIQLASVQFPHIGTTTPVLIELGMTIDEQKQMPSQRSVTRLSQWPVARLLSGIGRYGYGRRSDQELGYFYDANLLSTLSAFGGPPVWVPFSTPASSLNPETGDLWVPAGTLLSYYTDVKMRYCAGWSAAGLPPQIKVACAALVDAMAAAPMGPQIRRFNAGKTSIERFADSILDGDIKSMLRPYMANWMI